MSLVTPLFSDAVSALLAPIDARLPAGLFDQEDETYQAVDQEMIKLGGLQQGTIDWPYIDEASRQYLGRQCKHFRIVGHLITLWVRSGRWDDWSDALCLLSGMVECYWESAHPKPGPTGYLAKRKQVRLMLERLGDALPSPAASHSASEPLRLAREALLRLLRCAEHAQLDVQAITSLQSLLNRHVEQGEQSLASAEVSSKPAIVGAGRVMSPGNEREARRAALALAEQINQQDLYDPTGYQLRRFALWGHLQAAPGARRERCTELTSVPRDLADAYQEALNAASLESALLLRIEKSVSVAPFWFRGNYLSAAVATRLAMDEVAAAIRQASARFVRRVPGVLNLCFSDGTAFVDEPTRVWLTGTQHAVSRTAPAYEYAVLHDELVAQLGTEGVEAVLLRLQTLQAGYHTPRQRCHASVMAAELLEARGLKWLADDLYAHAARLMAAMPAHEWEPDLYRRLMPSPDASVSRPTKL